jgi:eukaryotic-like serine/threonine-protein kinase
MADLYLAVSEGPAGFSKLFVIKRLRNAEDPQHVAMFLDEARLAARLSHPHIVETYEIGEEHGAHFMVMEHLPGPTVQQLRQRHSSQGRIAAALELEIMCHVLEGLHYAHELCGYDGKPLQVVHRDLSPENVIVTALGETKVLDFGIAKTMDSLSHTEAGFYKGKLTKMPPEQLLGETVDRRADIFAAGVMLWEGLSGRSLWGDLGGPAIAHCLASRDIPPLPTNADVPEDLKWLCARAIHADPDGRWSTAQAFRAALQGYMEQHQVVVTRAQLGAFVEPLFVEERERLNKILEAQLRPRDRGGAAPAGTMPLPRRDSTVAAPGPSRTDPYYEQVVLEGVPTRFDTKSKQPATARSGKTLWALAAVAVFAVAAFFGVQRIMRGFEMSAGDNGRPTTAAPSHAPGRSGGPPPPVIPAPMQSPDPAGADRQPSRAATRAVNRRARGVAARRQGPPRLAQPDGDSPPPRRFEDNGFSGAQRRLDGQNPYGGDSAHPASRSPSRRNIDRTNPWQVGSGK